MSTPEGDFETAVDQSNDREAREGAIDELDTANECDTLADLVRLDELETEYREQALDRLASPQCRPALEPLVDDSALPDTLREQAERLLEDVPDDVEPGS